MPKQVYFYAALFWTGLILFFCLIRSSTMPSVRIPNLDKLVHAFLHFVLTTLWFLFFKKQFEIVGVGKPLLVSVLFSFVFGIAIEVMQHFFTLSRSADVLDVVANLCGAILAVIAIALLAKWTRIEERI